jgi:hypothetical protein
LKVTGQAGIHTIIITIHTSMKTTHRYRSALDRYVIRPGSIPADKLQAA